MTESSMDKTPDSSGNRQPLSLMKRVIRGSAWTLGGHVTSQVIRLVSNLIVSRLLFPEAFGLMSLVYTFLAGLEMLSDIGVGPSIVQSKRGDDPKFLNTGWTVQAIRGGLLWLSACLIGFPAARFYNEPVLQFLLPVAGLGTLMTGLTSTKYSTANRHLALGRLTTIDLVNQVAGIVVMVICAWIAHNTHAAKDVAVWSLAAGSLVSAGTRLVLTHVYLEGPGNRFEWDKESLIELGRFGRWIFLSTLMTFFALQGNNLVIPRLLGVGFFGVFSFAQSLSGMANNVINLIGHRVLFPSYSELFRDRPERLYPVLKRSRVVLNLMNWSASLFFIFFGKSLIRIMYDQRYADAGWILQILAIGSLVTILGYTYMDVLMAQGKTFIMSALMGVQVAFQFASIFIGYYLGSQHGAGEYGAVIGIAAMSWALYPVQAICFIKLKVWQPEVDLPAIALASGIAVLVFFHYI